jgi:hypothetical protein
MDHCAALVVSGTGDQDVARMYMYNREGLGK